MEPSGSFPGKPPQGSRLACASSKRLSHTLRRRCLEHWSQTAIGPTPPLRSGAEPTLGDGKAEEVRP